MNYPQKKVPIGVAAEMLGMSPTWVRQMADSGELPCERPGRHRRFRIADITAFIHRRRGKGSRAKILTVSDDPLLD